MSVTAMIILMALSVPMLMNVLMTPTICAMLTLTALIPQAVTHVLVRLHSGKAKAWTVMMVVQDVLTSMIVQLEPTTMYLSMALMITVLSQVEL